MNGFTTPKASVKLRQCLIDIYEAAKDHNIYTESEHLFLVRISKLRRCFTICEANEILFIHGRIPSEPKEESEPVVDDKMERRQNFYG